MDVGFELVEHTADIGVRAWGRTRAEVFEEAARGMFSLVCDPREIADQVTVEVDVEAAGARPAAGRLAQRAALPVRGAPAAVRRHRDRRARTTPTCRARLTGERLDPDRHVMCGGVKAATLHQLSLLPRDGGWEGFVILDV